MSLYFLGFNIFLFIIFNLLGLNILPREDLILSIDSINNPLSFVLANYMHTDIFHILFNMFILFQFGRVIDSNYQLKEQILIYFYSGLAISGIMYLYIMFVAPHYSVLGFSGIACFIIGACLNMVGDYNKKSILIQMAIFHVLIIAMNLPISWEAHLIGGVLGYLYSKNRFLKEDNNKNKKRKNTNNLKIIK